MTIIYINTGTRANSGDGDSIRTAFTKINANFANLEETFATSGVTSFNGFAGVVTFTATNIIQKLGYVPYNASNPLNFVTSSLLDARLAEYINGTVLEDYATKQYVTDQGYVTLTALGDILAPYPDKEYVNELLATSGYTTFTAVTDYITLQGFITNEGLGNFLSVEQFVSILNGTEDRITSATEKLILNSDGIINMPRNGWRMVSPASNSSSIIYSNPANTNLELSVLTERLTGIGGSLDSATAGLFTSTFQFSGEDASLRFPSIKIWQNASFYDYDYYLSTSKGINAGIPKILGMEFTNTNLLLPFDYYTDPNNFFKPVQTPGYPNTIYTYWPGDTGRYGKSISLVVDTEKGVDGFDGLHGGNVYNSVDVTQGGISINAHRGQTIIRSFVPKDVDAEELGSINLEMPVQYAFNTDFMQFPKGTLLSDGLRVDLFRTAGIVVDEFQIKTANDSDFVVKVTDVSTTRTLRLSSTGILTLPNGTAISDADPGTNITVNDNSWTFGNDGTLNLPETTSAGNSIVQSTYNVQINSNGNLWTFGTDGNLTLPVGGEIKSAAGTGDVVIEANDGVARTWTFKSIGTLNLPNLGSIPGAGVGAVGDMCRNGDALYFKTSSGWAAVGLTLI
jgi:hypothetical protein